MNRQLEISTGICVALLLTGAADWGTRSTAAQEINTTHSAARLPTQSPPSADQPVDSTDPGLANQAVANEAVANEALVNEIQAIRKQLGGGIAQRLNGLDLGKPGVPMSAEQVFNQELDRLANQALQPSGVAPSTVTTPGHRAPAAHVSRPLEPRSPTTDRAPTAVRLRLAARGLEEIAADLEDIRLFQDADEIREQSRKFWRKAREFDSGKN